MKINVTTQQIRHFSEFGWIELEGFLTNDECKELLSAIQKTLLLRLHSDKLTRFDSERIYGVGRDCWRDTPLLKRHFLSQRFANTASNLTNKKPLLLACDQWIPAGKTLMPLHLIDHLSFQNLVCGCLLLLENGNVRFFQPERLPLFNAPQILIAYGCLNTVYIHNPGDPLNAYLKSFGYSFNDRLNAEQNPLC